MASGIDVMPSSDVEQDRLASKMKSLLERVLIVGFLFLPILINLAKLLKLLLVG
jgi:hypothetical protein